MRVRKPIESKGNFAEERNENYFLSRQIFRKHLCTPKIGTAATQSLLKGASEL